MLIVVICLLFVIIHHSLQQVHYCSTYCFALDLLNLKSLTIAIMKFSLLLFLSSIASSTVEGFVTPPQHHVVRSPTTIRARSRFNKSTTSSSSSSLNNDFGGGGSDFGSAMPAKPEISVEEKMNQSAYDFIENMENALSEKSTKAPPELAALKEARSNKASKEEIAAKVYDLMIERAMLYDEDPDTGSLSPTGFDIPNNLDIPEVKKEFKHLYEYGMNLMKRGFLDGETLKETVLERLVKRTGLTPEEFDTWLGY
jgi:hypothetical protein